MAQDCRIVSFRIDPGLDEALTAMRRMLRLKTTDICTLALRHYAGANGIEPAPYDPPPRATKKKQAPEQESAAPQTPLQRQQEIAKEQAKKRRGRGR